MDFVTIASLPSGTGFMFMHTISVKSGNLNFLEGCYRIFLLFTNIFIFDYLKIYWCKIKISQGHYYQVEQKIILIRLGTSMLANSIFLSLDILLFSFLLFT